MRDGFIYRKMHYPSNKKKSECNTLKKPKVLIYSLVSLVVCFGSSKTCIFETTL